MTIRDVLRRLEVAEATINPANSLGARLKRLTADQRAAYDQWRAILAKWQSRYSDEPDALYAAILNGNDGPQLPSNVRRVLFGTPPTILATDSHAIVYDKYSRWLEQL